MPNVDRPDKPRPKELVTGSGEYSYVSCEDPISQGTEIFDWDGSSYVPTPTGTYTFVGVGSKNVTNGVIQ